MDSAWEGPWLQDKDSAARRTGPAPLLWARVVLGLFSATSEMLWGTAPSSSEAHFLWVREGRGLSGGPTRPGRQQMVCIISPEMLALTSGVSSLARTQFTLPGKRPPQGWCFGDCPLRRLPLASVCSPAGCPVPVFAKTPLEVAAGLGLSCSCPVPTAEQSQLPLAGFLLWPPCVASPPGPP